MQTNIIDAPPPKTTPANEGESPCYGVAFNLEFGDVLMFSAIESPLANLLKADVTRALSEAGLLLPTFPDPANPGKIKNRPLVFAHLNYISGLFLVSDWFATLAIMEAELKRMGLLSHAEIGWRDRDEDTWRRHFPKPAGGIFQPLVFTIFEQPPLTPKLQETLSLFLKVFSLANLCCANPAIAPQIMAAIRTAMPPPSPGPQPGQDGASSATATPGAPEQPDKP